MVNGLEVGSGGQVVNMGGRGLRSVRWFVVHGVG